jgi:hypothetical protein
VGLLDGVLAVFQATSDVRMSNPKWSEIQILSILKSLFVLLFSTAVEINVWEIAVFECAFMKRVKLGARDSVLHGNRSLCGSGVAKL